MDREGSPNSLVFFNLPASGHVNPTLPLVAELSRRGDRVLYYTGDQFRDQVERQGAEFRSYGRHLTYDHSPGYLRFRRAARRLRRTYHVEVGGLFDLFLFRDRLTIAYTSPSFLPDAERFDESVRFVGPLLRDTEDPDPALMRSLDDNPLAYVSMGTVAAPSVRFLRACIEAFADGDEILLLSVGVNVDPASLGPLPRNCIVRETVPQLAVLHRARLFITHGGMNSVSEGLALGVPLLLYPQSPEQGIIAARVAELGAGRTIEARDATPAGIRAAADAVISGPYREAARSVGRDLRSAGGAPAAADAIEELIAATGA